MFFFFLCIFVFLINFDYISYNENFLLCIFFILFFIIVYNLIRNIFKNFIFLKIFKNFFILLIILKLNIYFNRLLIFYYITKLKLLFKYINKIRLLKKKSLIDIKNIFNYYIVIINFLYYFNINKKFITYDNFINLYLLNFFIKIKKNDFFLFL